MWYRKNLLILIWYIYCMTLLDDEIAAILKDGKKDPLAALVSRLENYIKTANSMQNRLIRCLSKNYYNQTGTCSKLIPRISDIFKDANNAEWKAIDPAMIDPEDPFAAIWGAFIAIFPEYTQQIPPEIRARLPIPAATNWFQHFGIKTKWENLAENMYYYPDLFPTLFPMLPKEIQYATVDSNIIKELRHPDNTDIFLESCTTIKTIFPHLDDNRSTKVIDELLFVVENYQEPAAINTLVDIYPYIKNQTLIFNAIRK